MHYFSNKFSKIATP